jgi:Methylase of polypeptide chain release factors
VLNVIERRAGQRVPAAYITQEAWMHGFRFYVDERVIVPRSFIGELLQDGCNRTSKIPNRWRRAGTVHRLRLPRDPRGARLPECGYRRRRSFRTRSEVATRNVTDYHSTTASPSSKAICTRRSPSAATT